jgi:hypothetical protein
MNKTFLTGIVALFLATGAAHAMPYAAYRCGKHQITMIPGKYHTTGNGCTKGCDGKSHYYDDKDRIIDRWVRDPANGPVTFKGKQCRELREWEIK